MWPSNFTTPDHLTQDSLLISSVPARELDSFEMEGNELAIRRSFWGLDWDILLGHLQNIFEATVRQPRFYPGPHAVLWNQTWLKWFSPPTFQITSFWGIYFKNGVLMQTWLKYLPENLSLVASMNSRKSLCLFAFWWMWKKHESTLSDKCKAFY